MTSSSSPLNDIDLRPEADAVADGCLSDFALDMLVATRPFERASERTKDVDASLTALLALPQAEHARDCGGCKERLRLMLGAQQEAAPSVARLMAAATAQIAAEDAAHEKMGDVATDAVSGWRARWTRWWTAVPVSLAAAAAIAFVAWPTGKVLTPRTDVTTGDVTPAAGLRTKGTAVRFFVKRGEAVTLGKSGDTFAAGDALRFVVTSGAPSNLLLFGVSQTGMVSAYFPFGGSKSQPVDVGAEIPLPGSLVLDESPDTEFIGAIFSAEPLSLSTVAARVQDALAATSADGTLDLATLRALPLDGAVHWIELQKAPLGEAAVQSPPSHTVDDREEVK